MTEPLGASGVRLDELIADVEAAHADPLGRVAGAVLVGDRLAEAADHLVGHFVDEARRAGASWADVGRSLGVTRQAAQQRFVPRDEPQDFSRFTPRARTVVAAAQTEARAAGGTEIRPEHLALGLLSEPTAVAGKVLAARGVTAEGLRHAVAAVLPPEADDVPPIVPFGAAARKVLELTVREALRMDQAYVGTEHVLLALLEQEGGSGVLSRLGVDRAAVDAVLARYRS